MTEFNMKLSKSSIRFEMRKLMKCMDYSLKIAEQKNSNIHYDIYQLLGAYAWGYIAEHCPHVYKVSKQYPLGKCTLCGTVN